VGVVAAVACIVNLLPLCQYEKIRVNEKIGYSCDLDTITFYFAFSVLKIGKIGPICLDTKLIQVAPRCHDTGGACLSIS
jgi:hypothetical protein